MSQGRQFFLLGDLCPPAFRPIATGPLSGDPITQDALERHEVVVSCHSLIAALASTAVTPHDPIMTDSFTRRMADLDALVERCRGEGVFAVGAVRDTSNRSDRDWPWWGVEVELTNDDGIEKRRITAEVILNAPAPGVPSVFKGRWRARIWQGVSVDSFTGHGDRSFAWTTPSAEELRDALGSLLDEAEEAMNRADPSKS